MNFHPHIHAIVLGGGLDVKNHWKDNGKDFFLPIKVISKTFRGKDVYKRQMLLQSVVQLGIMTHWSVVWLLL